MKIFRLSVEESLFFSTSFGLILKNILALFTTMLVRNRKAITLPLRRRNMRKTRADNVDAQTFRKGATIFLISSQIEPNEIDINPDIFLVSLLYLCIDI